MSNNADIRVYSLLIMLCMYIAPGNVNAQITTKTVSQAQLPSNLIYKGNFKAAQEWNEASKKHLLLLCETGIMQASEENREAALYAYHYIIEKDSIMMLWKIYDFIKECPFDVITHFLFPAIKITDLNKNGTSEIWVGYELSCRSDVSPTDMKIIMYEGKKKHAIRGQNVVLTGMNEQGKKEYMGGSFTMDNTWNNESHLFSDFAKALWNTTLKNTKGE